MDGVMGSVITWEFFRESGATDLFVRHEMSV